LNFRSKLRQLNFFTSRMGALVMLARRIQAEIVKRIRLFISNLRIGLWNFRIKLPKLDLLAPQIGALIILALGIGLAIVGFRIQHPSTPITLATLFPDFYANASTTLVGIALTVLIIDALNRRRDDRLEKIRLIRDMGCGDNGIALRAVVEITENNLHWKGFLRNRHFWCARLAGAQLMSADLSYSSFHHADITGAVLYGAKLLRTSFWHAQMRDVDFKDADLTGADFIYADLTRANVTKKQLQSADRLLGVRLPNGNIYDGRFNRPGDLSVAQTLGVDVNDPMAMANFYAMPYDQFMHSSDLRKDRPELTDWGQPVT
jgi:uncharacterized protein YjbI with pentapeptide repeats